MRQKEELMRFVVKIDKCWLWIGGHYNHGYGKFWNGDRYEGAHRASYRIFVGPIPPDMLVCHTCDNPSCVNPDHLFVGTMKDNMQDSLTKGRNPKTLKDICLHGHILAKYEKGKRRKCKECSRIRRLEYRIEKGYTRFYKKTEDLRILMSV